MIESGQDPAALDGVVSLGGLTYVPTAATSSGKAPASTKSKRSLPPSTEENQEFADSLVKPVKDGSHPGSDQSEHMFSPESTTSHYEEEGESSDGLGESPDRRAMNDAPFRDNITSTPVATHRLVKRAYDYTG